jgi:flagellar biosynthesis/type III secretory pathway protein FliH
MKQTAVEFLSEKYMYVTWLRNRDEISASWADNLRAEYLEQAKEMEKEQIINGFEEGFKENYRDNGISGEEYYYETYK